MFDLKPLSKEAVPAALAKAERYRLINQPEQAESICEDVLEAAPRNRDAVVMLILSLTDQFAHHEAGLVGRAQALVEQLDTEYERLYYAGLIAERRARALVERGGPGSALPAGDWLHKAFEWFERAEAVRPAGNDDVLLRWNACVRLVERYPHLIATENEPSGQPIMLE